MTDTPREGAAPTGEPAAPPLLNIANILTMVRIALVPVFIWFLVLDTDGQVFGAGTAEANNGGWRWAAAGVFALAVLTDKIDGDLARSRNLVTDFGKIADPIADKLLIGAGLVMLSLLGELPWWVTVVILARELGVTVLRMVVIRYGVMPASRGGKLKTVLQSAGLQLMLLPLVVLASWLADVAFWIMILALVVTVVTGVDYLISAIRMRSRVRRDRADAPGPGRAGEPSDG
ncbi:CDP-diacylglycerol--glycerol-3-phosphate 3-phosphatidyltransferase [Nesterenkonia jeotgali]|uniref:CDP-diacylglycerol--glycerol-3-phosphate 3-phosphatidyltransferase n=1 Tax=Nesterenkonia jeotgali TaxID=317018 RepID=A0A0W8IG30_9MICC|nr:CDP-diacylglycerol--glycerol-3-phosphate 3-phosphatidyltransferase [Nesterenkonia jeotgali]KUG58916.1 CDP-diacylglycerol--glycerol-3-phosphate 3-phosphatidyltransferase [Nesterenkonia jeotgali]